MSFNKIVYFFSVLLAGTVLTSCLGEPEEITPSTRTIITSCSFGSDITAYTSNIVRNDKGEQVEVKDTTTYSASSYPFEIDQLACLIYTKDSLPVGSKIDKMPITISSAGAYATRLVKDKDGNEVDTVWASTDSLDLRNPVKIKVYASDQITTRTYTISVKVHKVDPDSLAWNMASTSFSGGKVTGKQKSIILHDDIITYAETSDGVKAYYTNYKAATVQTAENSITGIANPNILSAYVFNGKVFMTATDGKLYNSSNGKDWTEVSSDGNMKTIVGAITSSDKNVPDKLVLIAEENGQRVFRTMKAEGWTTEKRDVPTAFPVDNFTGFEKRLATSSNYRMNVMGKEDENNALSDTISFAWFTSDGLTWTELEGISTKTLPKMNNMAYIYYNDMTYCFGYGPDEKFDNMYQSEEYGLVWNECERKVMLPYEFKGRTDFSYVVTDDNYIWIFWSKTNGTNDEVWKGRINKLGFATE